MNEVSVDRAGGWETKVGETTDRPLPTAFGPLFIDEAFTDAGVGDVFELPGIFVIIRSLRMRLEPLALRRLLCGPDGRDGDAGRERLRGVMVVDVAWEDSWGMAKGLTG